MSKKLLTSAELQDIFNGSDEKTDFKKQLQLAIDALGANEVIIVNLNTAAESATASISDFKIQVTNLTNLNNQLASELEVKEEDLSAATETIEDLGRQLDLQAKNSDGPLIVKVGNSMKKIIGNRFSFPNEKELDAKGLSERPDLLEKMLANGSGALVDAE